MERKKPGLGRESSKMYLSEKKGGKWSKIWVVGGSSARETKETLQGDYLES